jgi:hypothetical protein
VKQRKIVPGALCNLRDSRAGAGRGRAASRNNNNNKPAALPSFDNTVTEEPSLTTNDSVLVAYLISCAVGAAKFIIGALGIHYLQIATVVKDFFENRIAMAFFDWPVMAKATVNAPKHFHVLKTLGLVAGYLFFLACSSNCVAHAGQKASSVFNSYFVLCYILWLAFVPFAFLNLVLTPFLMQAVGGPLSGLTTSDIVSVVLVVLSVIIISGLVWFGRAIFARFTQIDKKIDDLGKKVDGFVGSMHQLDQEQDLPLQKNSTAQAG